MKNYGWEIREEARALVSRSIEGLSNADVDRLCGRNAKARQVLFAAAELLIFAVRGGSSIAADDALREALVGAEWTQKKYDRLPKSTRAIVEAAILRMTSMCQPTPPEPDGLSEITADFEREDAEAADIPFDGCAIEPSEVSQVGTYEVLIGTGVRGWQAATVSGGKWYGADSGFLAYPSSITAVRIPGAVIHQQVKLTLDYYATLLPGIGEEEADAKTRSAIRRGAAYLVYGAASKLPLAVDADRSESWWRVHDAILRGYLRFKIHLDVDGPDVAAAA